MLKDFVDKKHYKFAQRASDWREAIRMSCEVLEADGTVNAGYKEDIIRFMEAHGPYVVLAPGIVMPHVQPSEASDTKVTNSTIAFMHLEEPVSFDDSDPEKYGKIFFTLAVKDVDDHFQCMVKIVNMLNNPEIMNALMDAHGPEDLLALQEKYGDIINVAL